MIELSWTQALSPSQYDAHPLHALDRDWPETNCYIDVWVELLHALGAQVEPCLGSLLAASFEGDQWTFSKPAHRDLELLYGIEVEELNLWRTLLEHVQTQLSMGRVPLVEVDSFFLPDTRGSDYGTSHTKTTVAMVALDVDRRTLRYFHNRGYHALESEDFDGVFRLDVDRPARDLLPFCEVAKLSRLTHRPQAELRERALTLARHHFARRPESNPVQQYCDHLDEHVRWIAEGGLDTYHAYSFSLVRQLGANAELLAAHARFFGDEPAFLAAAESFTALSAGAKALMLKLARVAHSGRPRDLSGHASDLAALWERAMQSLADPLSP